MKTKLFLASGAPFLVTALLTWTTGCEVTSEKIQTWKQTVKGAAKIRAALRDGDQSKEIRVEAGEALCEMGLFVPLIEDMKALGDGDRKQIMEALSRQLIARMEGSNPGATTGVQLQAKDGLFALRDMASESLRRNIDEKVVRWLLADWQKRSSGEHSAEKIVKTIGAGAAPVLVDMLGQGAPLVVSARLLREVGGASDRDQGADKLVELAGKQKPAKVETFHAIGKIGSVKGVAFLIEVARRGEYQKRLWALRALALFPHPSAIPVAKAIAGDTSLKDDKALLRDEAFTVLEKIDDPGSLRALLGFVSEKDKLVRYRAVEAVISGFGAKALTKLLDALPPGYTYKKEDLEDFIEKDIQGLGKSALPALREALGSDNWVARLVAARVLGRIGTKQDVTALEKLGSDNTKLRGWDGGATVGSEAQSAAKRLQGR